jgi:3-oxoacyl-(acyl-carrier-protein) synthase
LSERRPVRVSGIGLLCPAGIGSAGAGPATAGPVPGFRARDYIDDRKSLKLMTTSVRLGVAAIRMAIEDDGDLASVPASRRGLYVGTSPQPGDPDDLGPALEAALDPDGAFDIHRFGRDGYPLIHPLWLVRGLSNNVIGFASAIHDLQGVNMNYCDGIGGGWNAMREGALAVAEGRADLVVAGGSDAWVVGEALVGQPCGNGAAFLVFRPGRSDCLPELDRIRTAGSDPGFGFLGAATWPIAVARHLLNTSS